MKYVTLPVLALLAVAAFVLALGPCEQGGQGAPFDEPPCQVCGR